jgi:hypothetical protein
MSSNLSFLYEHSQKELDETYQEIKQLTEKCKSYETKIKDLEDKIEDLESDKEYYKFLYEEPEIEEDTENTETDIETDVEYASSEIRKEIENDIEKEDKLINLGLEINRLQFEISELFHLFKKDITDIEYERYKTEKRNYYKLIEVLNSIYKGENKLDIFDILIKIIKKEKRVYECDLELENLQ